MILFLAQILESNSLINPTHHKLRSYISIAWLCSTIVGILLFLIELLIIIWVKFWSIHQYTVAWISTIILIPVFIAFWYFAFHFYQKLVKIEFEKSDQVLHELQDLVDQIDHYENK